MKQMFGFSKTDRYISVHTLQVCNTFSDLYSIIISQLWWHRMLSRLYRRSHSLLSASGVANVNIKAIKPNEQQTHTQSHPDSSLIVLHFSGSWPGISLAYLVHIYSLLSLLPLHINISSGNYIQQTAQHITCHYSVNDNAERERQNENARGRKLFDNNKSNNNEDREEYEIPPAYRLPQDVYSVYLPLISFSSCLLYSSFSNVWKRCIIDNVSSQIMKD